MPRQNYTPALRHNGLTFCYDPLMRWVLREKRFKEQLAQQANLKPGHRVLDLGCGTATLAILLKQMCCEAQVFGLDADSKVLKLAGRKAASAGLRIGLSQSFAHETNFADASFDRVVSSLLFHHLTPANKQKTLDEIARILKPDGELHIVDFGLPQNRLLRCAFLPVQLLDGFATTTDSVQGKLSQYMQQSGFVNVRTNIKITTLFGSVSLYSGSCSGTI